MANASLAQSNALAQNGNDHGYHNTEQSQTSRQHNQVVSSYSNNLSRNNLQCRI